MLTSRPLGVDRVSRNTDVTPEQGVALQRRAMRGTLDGDRRRDLDNVIPKFDVAAKAAVDADVFDEPLFEAPKQEVGDHYRLETLRRIAERCHWSAPA